LALFVCSVREKARRRARWTKETFCWRMILSENRYPLFRIMLGSSALPAQQFGEGIAAYRPFDMGDGRHAAWAAGKDFLPDERAALIVPRMGYILPILGRFNRWNR
jgi:hypothetical protein